VGLTAYLPSPPEDGEPFRSYNAAVRYDPETGQADNFQSKIRLYPGGEYAPWEGTFLEAILGRPGKAFTPGEVRHVYRLGAARHPYVVNVCSEMKFPIFRGRLEPAPTGPETRRPFAFIVSLANEGLFQRNHAQVELRDCTIYRAIERRVGVARSSNSGVSGFASPSGRLYSMVTNRLGQTRALLGSPELPLIRDTIEFRTRNRDAFATNATLRAELERRMGEIEAARERAGIEGWTVDQVLISDTDTLFERLGDWLSPVTFLLLAAMNLAGLPPRRKVQRVSSTG
jgi:hypothetical protein